MYKHERFPVQKVQLSNGCHMAYIDEGRGDTTLLFVHGLATYGNTWARNIEHLRQYYRCIAVDLPGNGHSDKGSYPYGVNFYSGCLYDFIQKLNLRNVVPVGHSMGGQIVLNLVISQPDVCERMVLCAPAGFETFTAMEQAMYKASIHFFDFFSTEENSLRQTIKTSFFNYPADTDEMVKELVALMKAQPVSQYRKMIDACVDGMINEPVFSRLHTIRQQALVLFGERDALIPNRVMHPTTTQSIGEKGTSEMPNAVLHILPKCGHFLQLEQPGKVNELIKEFLTS